MTKPGLDQAMAAAAWEDVLDRLEAFQGASQLTLHRGGTAIAATVSPSTRRAGESFESRIWSFPLDGTPAAPLTQGPGADALPAFSPTDDAMAFASDRDSRGRMSLFLQGDGSARSIGTVPGTIEDLHWAEDGTSLLVLAADPGLHAGASSGAFRLAWEPQQDPEVSRKGLARRRLFRVRRSDGETTEVGPPDRSVWEFAPATATTVLALVSEDSSERGWYRAELAQLDVTTRTYRVVYRSAWQLQGPAMDPTGRFVAFIEGWSSDRGLLAGEIRLLNLADNTVRTLAGSTLTDIVSLQWQDPGSLRFAGWSHLGSVYGTVNLDGVVQDLVQEAAVIGPSGYFAQLLPLPDNKGLFGIREAVGEAPEIYVRSPDAAWHALSGLNRDISSNFPAYPDIHEIAWEGAGGLRMEGLLLLPPNRESGPGPMIVEVHGGPTASVKTGFNPGSALPFVAAGYAVFLPNYRGSAGRGQDFARLNIGDPAGAEFEDILRGIDWCIAEGFVDAGRIGITGVSYGGYMTAWAVATTTRFKAAVMISGIADHLSCHYSANHDFAEFIIGGPLSSEANRTLALARSPLYRLHHPTTPTLIIHGREDHCTPIGQAEAFYAGLRESGATVELAIYPREGHGLQEDEHRRDAWGRAISWFDLYLRTGS
jgi:dipeptidyl aminopeptidase/acylaminoacyl peptidase